MDEFDSLSHTKWECKYHVVVCCERDRVALAEAMLHRR